MRARSPTTGLTRGSSCCRIACSPPTPPGARRGTSSGWSAKCDGGRDDPTSCRNALQDPELDLPGRPELNYAWTGLTYLLHEGGVRWGYYVSEGTSPDWNPLPNFGTVRESGQLGNIRDVSRFYEAAHEFVEDVFLSGQRLDPQTDGWPDPRPTVRESVLQLGDLADDFDFDQEPRAPVVLPERPSLGTTR